MSRIDPRELLGELKYNIRRRDIIKADIVLSYLEKMDEDTVQKALGLLQSSDGDFFFRLIARLEKSNPDFLSAQPEMEKLLVARALKEPDLLARHIKSQDGPSPVLIKTAGKADLPQTVPALTELLDADPDPETAREILKAMRVLAQPGTANSISRYLYTRDNRTVSEAIRALAEIGTPTAMKRLAESLGNNNQTDLLILDLFSRVQDNIALDKLNETLSSHHAHLRNYAKTKLAAIGEKAVPFLAQNLLYEDPDLRIHSLNLLGEIGDSSAYPAIRKLLSEHPADSNVRFAAYEALGTISAQAGAHILGNGLTDPEEQVRVAAAGAIERSLSDLLIAGINNMLQTGPEERRNICTAIINARAVNTFLALFKTEDFRKEATRFLEKHAPEDLRNLFAAKLEKNGYQEEAEEISKADHPRSARSRALAVDDSRMILNIYKAALFNLGYDPVLFSRPDKALEWLKDNKPRVMFTDLNMPGMTGVELIGKTRELYSSSSLPIVMITTQNEVQDNRDAIQAGADAIGRKPFTSESLQSTLENLKKSTGG